jgi:3-oxoacyl-[acyl-carrier protein] reductase
MEQQVVLVTGASRGLGRAILMALASEGRYVVGTATSEKGAAAISDALKAAGHAGEGAVLNVSEATSIAALFEHLKAGPGMPNILVNNAGITRDNLFMRMKDEEWDDVIQTNLTSIFRMSRACIRTMVKARFGRIITVGSVVGTMGNAGQTNYCAAKAGLVGFSKALAREVASRNITVNVVAPGFMATDMTDALNDTHKEALLAAIPAARMGAPEDIANAVKYLASDEAGYVTGETIHVNGGMLMG